MSISTLGKSFKYGTDKLKGDNIMRQIHTKILDDCGQFLRSNGLKLLCAESMTAGYLSSIWALEVHSGDYFLGSLICYDDSMKTQFLVVPQQKIEKYCAESAVVTLRMLDGLSKLAKLNTVFISITGLAFESSNPQQTRPIGTVYYAFQYQQQKKIFKRQFGGEASDILIDCCNNLLKDLYDWLQECIK
ncbi:CinA family protein [Sphingobacterium wenxiniae]|nr:nicotinamide-nucleotide amidohydrolase family protein [Sphingobacterium wenxiniae]